MRSAWSRIAALARKDAAEIRSQPGVILPAAAMVIGIAMPGFFLLLVVPALTGEGLAGSDFAEAAQGVSSLVPAMASLTPEGQVQAFLLQQFLLFNLLVPIFAALSLAAQGIVGEKQARSLEPLLTTPLRVWELLIGKVLTPLVLSWLLMGAAYLLHLGALLALGEPGVWRSLFWPRTLLLFLVLGPAVSLTALLLAAIVSSRVSDARSAQQLGGLLVLPITGLFVAQLAGQFLLGTRTIQLMAAGVMVLNLLLLWVGIRVFQRDTILMRWK